MIDTPVTIKRTYYVLLLGNTLAASLIWGINTIFLLDAGLSNFEAFAANAFFTAGMVLFEVPTGIANFPAEITKMPRAWVEDRYNVTHWTEPARGGHFAAMEVPDLFVDDVRAFFRGVR